MKSSLLAALASFLLLCAGCQSLNWTAKNKPAKENAVAQNTVVREVPWTWRNKKKKQEADDMPSEIAARFEKSQPKSDGLKSATELVLEGNQAEVARNFPAARRAYESALQVDPANADAHHRLGILADMRQDYAAAQDHYEAALRQKPHDANLLSDFGYSHQLRGNANQSERFLLMALDLDGQHKQALKNLGSLYASHDRPHDALQAFRRFRSEAEAQQLLSQYFPDHAAGNHQAATNMLTARTSGDARAVRPIPSDEISVEKLRQMSPEQIFEVMEQRRQEAVRSREQKELSELRPDLQNSFSEEDLSRSAPPPNYEASRAPQDNAWAQQPSPPSNPNPGNSVPWSLGKGGNATGAAPPSRDVALAPPTSEQPFWNGAPLPPQGPATSASNAFPTNGANAPSSGQPTGYSTGPAGNTSVSTPPWWANEFSANAPAPSPHDATYNGSAQPGPSPASNTAWNNPPNATGPAAANDMAARQRAYQLAMSAGPGTMFPVLPTEAANSQNLAAPPSATGWGTDASNSYQEVRAISGWESPAQRNSPAQWQDAQTQLAPRSPTDNWNSPSSTPWPPVQEPAPSPRGVAPMPQDQNRLPVINPGPAWNAAPGGPAPQARPSSTSRNARTDAESEVVPAWFNAPRTQPGANGATSIQQWPYAPQ